MDLRSLRPGSRLQVAVVVVVVLVASVGGAWAFGAVGAPSVAGVENRFGPVDQQSTVVETDLVVHNPNPVGVSLSDTTVNYTVSMNDVAIAAGSKEGLSVGTGNTTLNFSTRMRNGKIPAWWVTHVRNDEQTTVRIDARARSGLLGGRTVPFEQTKHVQTDIIGQFNSNETRPVESDSLPPTVSNPVLYVNATRARWGNVTADETPIPMTFVMYNPHAQPYTITEVGYEITMNGVDVGAGSTEEGYATVIPPKGRKAIDTRTVIRNGKLDDWWVTHLQNDQVTHLRIDFYATVELPTGSKLRIPLDRLTYEKRIETDIFGNKNESAGGAGGTSTPTAHGATPATTAAPTSTQTATTAPTPTGTPTPTDSGGVLGGGDATDAGTATGTATRSPAPTSTATATDGGILGSL
ncbi:MAG: LEA type 2 family protein [Haloarculaceae archaeon]